jgi:hypothetical protein
LLKASSERERDRERDGGSEKITLVKIEENDDEGNREDVEDAERESLRHIKEYMRVFPLVYWYNRTGLSDVVPSFRFSNASQIFFFVPRARLVIFRISEQKNEKIEYENTKSKVTVDRVHNKKKQQKQIINDKRKIFNRFQKP